MYIKMHGMALKKNAIINLPIMRFKIYSLDFEVYSKFGHFLMAVGGHQVVTRYLPVRVARRKFLSETKKKRFVVLNCDKRLYF